MDFFSNGVVADWAAALISLAAVLWGIWQVRSDDRSKLKQRKEFTHEIASSAENVAIIWDQLAVLNSGAQADEPAAIDAGEQTTALRLDLRMYADTLEILLTRPDLTDGAVKCGVRGRYLALKVEASFNEQETAGDIKSFKEEAFFVLMDARRIRKRHELRDRRDQYHFQLLDEAKVMAKLQA